MIGLKTIISDVLTEKEGLKKLRNGTPHMPLY